MRHNFLAPVLGLLAAVSAPAILAQSSGPYQVLQTLKVGGVGSWDYVAADSAERRLYVARSGSAGSIHVYNLDTLAEIGVIPGINAHGVAIDDASHHGFATSEGVAMFDTKTLAVLKPSLDVQGNPDGYLADPITHHIYILSHSAPNVTVLNAADGAIVGTIDLGGAPEQSVLDGKGHLYIDIEDKSSIAVVDTASLKVLRTIDVSSAGGGCAGLAMDAKNGILFATCREKNNMIIVHAADGKILTALPTGVGSDGAAFNPATMEAFSTQGDGTLTIVKESSPTSFAVEQTVTTAVRARTLTLDAKTGHIITVTAEFGAPTAPATPGGRPPRAPMIPDTFKILVIGR